MSKIRKYNGIKQRLTSLEVNRKFQEKIAEIRRKINIPKEGCRTIEEVQKKMSDSIDSDFVCSINDKHDNNGRDYWVKDILEEFNLDSFYEKFIEDYIFYNDFFINPILKDIADADIKASFFVKGDVGKFCISNRKYNKNRSKIYVEINAETTSKDIRAIFPEIKKIQKNLVGFKKKYKYSSPKNLKIDKRIDELRFKKTPNKEISEIIKKEFPGHDTIMPFEISSRNARFKRKK